MNKFFENKSREDCARLFLPQNRNQLKKLSLDELNKIEETLLGCEKLERFSCSARDSENDRRYAKFYDYYSLYSRYNAAFHLCDLFDVTDIYDIGCGYVNQSFLLMDKPNISYTGIEVDSFSLSDYRNVIDASYPNDHCPAVEEVPPLCNGRIRFLRKTYPFEIHPKPHHMGIAFHSIAYRLPNENSVADKVRHILERIERNFDRLLLTIGYPVPTRNAYEYLPVWKKLMPDYEFFRIEYREMPSLVFATKIQEDIEKLRCAGWFPTYEQKFYMDGEEIRREYDFSLDQFWKPFPFDEFTFTFK